MITLLDGRKVKVSDIRFVVATHNFFLGSENITYQIRRADRIAHFPKYDYKNDYFILSGSAPLNTSTLSIFANQIVTDPLAAPLASLENQTKKLFGNFGIQTALVVLLIGIFLWMGGASILKGALKT